MKFCSQIYSHYNLESDEAYKETFGKFNYLGIIFVSFWRLMTQK